VREIHPTGQRFDPRAHEAVAVEDDPSVPRGHVLAVYRPGFWLGAQLLRPAQVSVTR
jgi:molecular chaperone GrpE